MANQPISIVSAATAIRQISDHEGQIRYGFVNRHGIHLIPYVVSDKVRATRYVDTASSEGMETYVKVVDGTLYIGKGKV